MHSVPKSAVLPYASGVGGLSRRLLNIYIHVLCIYLLKRREKRQLQAFAESLSNIAPSPARINCPLAVWRCVYTIRSCCQQSTRKSPKVTSRRPGFKSMASSLSRPSSGSMPRPLHSQGPCADKHGLLCLWTTKLAGERCSSDRAPAFIGIWRHLAPWKNGPVGRMPAAFRQRERRSLAYCPCYCAAHHAGDIRRFRRCPVC